MNREKQINKSYLGKIDGKEIFIGGKDHQIILELIGGQRLAINQYCEKIAQLENIITAMEMNKPEPEAPRIIIPGA